MDIELTDDGKAEIGMTEYILEVINIFGGDVSQPVISADKHNFMGSKLGSQ